MNSQKHLSYLVSRDDVIKSLPKFEVFNSQKDLNHLNRRMQQRAISWDMVKLAIAYGRFEYFSQAETWTLLDKSLVYTPYIGFVDRLRGLRIIAANYSFNENFKIITAYWAYDLRR